MKSMNYLKRESYGWKKIKRITNQIFNYNSIELTEKNNGYNLHNHLIIGIKNKDVSLSTIENVLFDTWSKITNKFGFGKVSRKCINVSDVTKTLGGHSGSSGDKSIEDLSKLPLLSKNDVKNHIYFDLFSDNHDRFNQISDFSSIPLKIDKQGTKVIFKN